MKDALSCRRCVALMDCRTSALRQASANTSGAVVGVQDRSGKAAAAALGGGQGVGDEIGAHVIGQGPAAQAA